MALSRQMSAAPPPPPGSYQPTNLIKSIESRLRDSVAGDSQQMTPQTQDALSNAGNVEALTGLDGAEEAFVRVSGAPDDKSIEDFGPPDRESAVGTHPQQLPAELRQTGNMTGSIAGPLNSQQIGSWAAGGQKMHTQDVIVVLSLEDGRQQELEDTAALWQVKFIASCDPPHHEHIRRISLNTGSRQGSHLPPGCALTGCDAPPKGCALWLLLFLLREPGCMLSPTAAQG